MLQAIKRPRRQVSIRDHRVKRFSQHTNAVSQARGTADGTNRLIRQFKSSNRGGRHIQGEHPEWKRVVDVRS